MKRRLIAMMLALCVFAGVLFCAPVASAESYTVYVISNTLVVYQSANTSAKKIGTMGFGSTLTCTAVSGDWAKVQNSSGASGFCAVSSLSTSNPNTLNISASINTANTPIYKVPSTSAGVWMKLKKGSTFTAVAVTRDNTWVRLKNGSAYGYVQAKYLSLSGSDNPEPDASEESSSGISGTVYAAVTALPVYASAMSSSKRLGSLYYGQSITCVAVTGSWAKVRNSGGTTGYCQISGLTAANPNNLSQTVYINTNNAPIYKIASSSASVWAKLKKGASFTAVAVTPDGTWTRLKNGNNYGYILTKYVSANQSEGEESLEQTVYVTAATLTAYESASASSKKLGTLYLGQSVTLIGAADGWTKVRNSSGTMGYCPTGGLSTNNPNTRNDTYYAKNKTVKLYQKPLTSASAASTVAQNTSLTVVCISEDGQWARIALSNGSFAYALASDLSEARTDEGSSISDITPVIAYTNETSVPVYASTSANSQLLGSIYFGQAVTCTGKGDTWARVVNESGVMGYCSLSALTTKNPNAYSTPIYAQIDGAKVYQKPLTSSTVLSTLPINGEVTGVAYNSDRTWYRVKAGVSDGYVETRYFATSRMNDAAQSGTIAKVVSLAQQYLGVPYSYTGQSPDGFDCSGFVHYVFKNAAGISLKRTAYSQGYDETYQKITNRVDLKVGDVIFFDTVDDDDLCDHEGIYLGNNQFIHASSGGGKVMISSLGTSTKDYYYRTYSWARRIIQ